MMQIEDMGIVTIPNTNLDTVTGHSMTAVRVTYYNNNGTMKGRDKYGHLHWFHYNDVSKAKEV